MKSCFCSRFKLWRARLTYTGVLRCEKFSNIVLRSRSKIVTLSPKRSASLK